MINLHNEVPRVAGRNRALDLKLVALAVVKDRLNWSSDLSEHVADTPDLLICYVERALGYHIRINWMLVTEEAEGTAIKEWQDYCQNVYDDVKDYVVKLLMADL